MDITAANLDILFRQASNLYQGALESTQVIYPEIATIFPMATQEITMAFLDRVPLFRKWHGNRNLNNGFAHSRTLVAEPWEGNVVLDKFHIEDENLAVFGLGMQQLGEAAKKWQDTMLMPFIASGITSVLGYDGVAPYSTAHPLLGGIAGGIPNGAPTTQSNLFLSTALTYDNYTSVRQAMRAWVGADGAPLGITPDVLMVPPQLEGAAKLILEADFLANIQATPNAPQTNVWKNSARLVVNPWLASKPTNWWLLDTSKVIKPFGVFQRQAPTMTALTSPTDANVFMNHQFIWGAEARGTVAETVWWLSAAATSAGSY